MNKAMKEKLISETHFVVFDLETTGFNTKPGDENVVRPLITERSTAISR